MGGAQATSPWLTIGVEFQPRNQRYPTGDAKGKGKQNQLNQQTAGTPDLSAEHQQEPPSPGTRKRKQSDCVTLEPWQTLTKTVHNLPRSCSLPSSRSLTLERIKPPILL
ncbi:hypothetical protein EMPS_09939 [Entomortierella parvispora]|uniref:Uncharacterized protein n=1 Tax=Entomortierella parvispora TaxID=205924 RepID=A0A9P3HIZ3_9FUNG|nr:hypothetical protein EMPS_09939 [Entomortierella parvispora]